MNTGEIIERQSSAETPESIEADKEKSELVPGRAEETADARVEETNDGEVPAVSGAVVVPLPAKQPPPTKDQVLQVVERVLEEGLRDTYLSMSPEQRVKFRLTGEELANGLRSLVGEEVRPSSVHRDVMQWLAQIPGANEFWLEQAGYIKTTKVTRELKDNAA
jgi:hypothetical protein